MILILVSNPIHVLADLSMVREAESPVAPELFLVDIWTLGEAHAFRSLSG